MRSIKTFALLTSAAVTMAGCASGTTGGFDRRAQLRPSANPSAVIATELAFARAAREKGQWTAFRDYMTDDAIWPDPSWKNVKAEISGLPDPAKPIVWEPDQVFSSCDGSYVFSTGPATWPSGWRSRFTTVWQRQENGRYRFVLDQSFDLESDYAKREMIGATVADCPAGRSLRARPVAVRRSTAWQSGQSDDGTLSWTTTLAPDCARVQTVSIRRGDAMEEVFRRQASAPEVKSGSPKPSC